MDKMLDGNSAAEIQRDQEEIPESILERAREELREKALDGLTFQQVGEALAEIPKCNQDELLRQLQFRSEKGQMLFSTIVYLYVDKYLEPSQESVQQRAEEILAEMDYAKGEDI